MREGRGRIVALKACVRSKKKLLLDRQKTDARRNRVRRLLYYLEHRPISDGCAQRLIRSAYSGKKRGMTKSEAIIIISWSGRPTRA